STGNLTLADVTGLIKRILIGTFLMEGLGAVALSFYFIPRLGVGQGIYNAVFHSISAFCNAGFDLMGRVEPFSSFTTEVGNPFLNVTIITLIIVGGIGFIVWDDLLKYKWHFKKYCLHSKLALISTAVLLLGGTLFFYFSESSGALSGLSGGEKWLAAAFQSVTLRTAGFNTVDQTALSGPGSILSMIFMVIGGSPGSTAGGVKTVTVAVVILTAFGVIRNRHGVEIFRKKIPANLIHQAFAVVMIYLLMVFAAAMVLSWIEPFDLRSILYEISSAVGTVGTTMGITARLSAISKVIITFLMFFGRIGGLSLAMAFSEDRAEAPLQRPEESILIG
ncbi:MAG: Trk family potassium uptake protein, partial [Clostridia bacterium]|nr:Trk family potassium uptake protein [Clostridia bacterium]